MVHISLEQVLSGGGAGERVLLADCPSEAHAALLPAALAHLAQLDDSGTARPLDAVVHMSPPDVPASATLTPTLTPTITPTSTLSSTLTPTPTLIPSLTSTQPQP